MHMNLLKPVLKKPNGFEAGFEAAFEMKSRWLLLESLHQVKHSLG